jgi:predicted permease
MFWLRLINSRLYGLLRKNRIEQEMDDEMRFHLLMRTRENVERGMRPDEAEREARRRFGNVGRIKDLARDIKGGGFMETLMQDLRYGARMLINKPGFTLIAVLTLALGVGANTAIFSVVYGVLLRPLSYPDPHRLVILNQAYPERETGTFGISQANVAMYRDQSHVFEKVAAYTYRSTGFNLTGVDQPQRVQAANVTFDLFDVLRVQPLLGRSFRPEEDTPGKNLVCILSYGMWRQRFGGDQQILGKLLILNDIPTEIVGVMPASFAFPNPAVELWVPIGLNPQRQSPFFYTGLARLKSGVQIADAQVETTNILRNAARQDPKNIGSSVAPSTGSGLKTVVKPLKDYVVGDTKKPLLLLLGAVGLVLLIACGNVANLLLAQATSRTREVALRLVLGATPGRVFRQLVTESMLLALIGSTAGSVLAWWCVRMLDRLPMLAQLPRIQEVAVNTTALVSLWPGAWIASLPSRIGCRYA